ncbi:YncE family protein [Mycolicibacterium iranicum]|uniref:SMP-30/Gluconolactonase/LRE-like region domain-containing protein n=1 Tax=Mycolicibacterium iranicum TaxID=912594 RepID=A0A1X1WEC5_MYCIR|nr:YncE family protein [Mycolicibacterium iranicum]ORV84946.1 hypothetical protein AWC12_00470 [Mycolicibacterium iranicum]
MASAEDSPSDSTSETNSSPTSSPEVRQSHKSAAESDDSEDVDADDPDAEVEGEVNLESRTEVNAAVDDEESVTFDDEEAADAESASEDVGLATVSVEGTSEYASAADLLDEPASPTVVAANVLTAGAARAKFASEAPGRKVDEDTSAGAVAATVASAGTPDPSVITTVTDVGSPSSVTVSPDGTRVYVISYDYASQKAVLSVVDTATNTTVGLPIPLSGLGFGLGVSPDGRRVYATNYHDGTINGGSLSVIDVATGTAVGTPISFEGMVGDVVVSRDGSRVYVAKITDFRTGKYGVAVVDTATNKLVKTIELPHPALAMAASGDGSRLYVTGTVIGTYGAGVVSVINTSTNSVIGTPISVGWDPEGVAVSPDGSRLYVPTRGTFDNTSGELVGRGVWVIDTATRTVVGAPIELGAFTPWEAVVSPDGSRVYVVGDDGTTGGVWVIDTATKTIVNTVLSGVGTYPTDIIVSPNGTHLYVIGSAGLVVLDAGVSHGEEPEEPQEPEEPEEPQEPEEPEEPEEPSVEEKIETIWEGFTFWAGFIPGVGSLLNAASLVIDLGQAVNAWNKRDADDFTEEIGDIVNDLIGLIPFGRQLTKINKVFGDAVANVGGSIADWIIDTWWERRARTVLVNV